MKLPHFELTFAKEISILEQNVLELIHPAPLTQNSR
jgi:hypothetical protein